MGESHWLVMFTAVTVTHHLFQLTGFLTFSPFDINYIFREQVSWIGSCGISERSKFDCRQELPLSTTVLDKIQFILFLMQSKSQGWYWHVRPRRPAAGGSVKEEWERAGWQTASSRCCMWVVCSIFLFSLIVEFLPLLSLPMEGMGQAPRLATLSETPLCMYFNSTRNLQKHVSNKT